MTYLVKPLKKYLQQTIILSMLMNISISCDRCFFKETNTGLQYKLVKKGNGTKAKNGQLLLIDISYQTKDKKAIQELNNGNTPVIIPYHENTFSADGGINEAISMLGKGDTFIFKIPAKESLGNDFPKLAPKYKLKEETPLYLQIYVKDIQDKDEFKKNLAQQHKAMIEKQKEETAKQLPKDIEIIDKYLTENHLHALSTPSGLRYIIAKPGKGGSPKTGNIVKINYVGKTLEGQIFDTNIEEIAQKNNMYDARRHYTPLEFKIGEGGIIPGFEEGIKLLKKQGKAHLFVPSVLAYGPRKMGEHIMPNSNLIFEVELVDIITG